MHLIYRPIYSSQDGTKSSPGRVIKTTGKDSLAPSETTKIDDNIYLAIAEVTNGMYLVFPAWTAPVYGKHSKGYENSLPAKSLWRSIDPKYKRLEKNHLRRPTFYTKGIYKLV